MLLPRLAALSEVQWCNADRKDWGRFYDAADDFCDICDTMGYNYAKHVLQVKADLKVDAEKKEAVVTLSAQGDAPIHYTLDGTVPTAQSQLYTGPVTVTQTCTLKAVAMNEGVERDVLSIEIPLHKALGKTVTYSRRPHPRYASGLPQSLVDGIRGPQIFKSQEWGAWNGDPVSLTIDMGETEPYSSVTVGMISDKPSYVFFPEKITVEVSEDGENFREFGQADIGVPDDAEPDGLADYMFTSEHEESARYIKITITPVKSIPDWHYAAGRRTYVFVDELIVL
jgi:hexosaminidase